MAIKGWVVHKVNRLFTRVDLPPRATPLGQAVMRAKREPDARGGAADSLPRPQHLGAYAPQATCACTWRSPSTTAIS